MLSTAQNQALSKGEHCVLTSASNKWTWRRWRLKTVINTLCGSDVAICFYFIFVTHLVTEYL